MKRTLIIAPSLGTLDGVARVADEVLLATLATNSNRVDVLTLRTGSGAALEAHRGRGRRLTCGKAELGARVALYPGLRLHDLTVISLHLHLSATAICVVARGAKLVQVLHGIESWRRWTYPRRAAVMSASLVVCNSEHTRSRWAALHKSVARRVRSTVCHLGIPKGERMLGGSRDGPPAALIVGRLSPGARHKGYDRLIAIWPLVRSTVPDAELWIVGEGEDRNRLEASARASPAWPGIRFFGRVSDSDLAKIYCASTVFVMPSTGDGFGLVYLEAMRAAKPVIAGAGAAEEIVLDGKTGFIVDSSETTLAAKLVDLLSDPRAAARLGRVGYRRFNGRFTSAAFRDRWKTAIGLIE